MRRTVPLIVAGVTCISSASAPCVYGAVVAQQLQHGQLADADVQIPHRSHAALHQLAGDMHDLGRDFADQF